MKTYIRSVRNKIWKLREVNVVKYKKRLTSNLKTLRRIRSTLQTTRQSSISFVIENYRRIIVAPKRSKKLSSLYADWLRSIFYCYITHFRKTNQSRPQVWRVFPIKIQFVIRVQFSSSAFVFFKSDIRFSSLTFVLFKSDICFSSSAFDLFILDVRSFRSKFV